MKCEGAAFLKAIDDFYDANGVERSQWPKEWQSVLADLFETRCRETLSTWGSHGSTKGRVDETPEYWNDDKTKVGVTDETSPQKAE